MNVDPEDLIPKLPKPKDLQPFPTTQSLVSFHVFSVQWMNWYPFGGTLNDERFIFPKFCSFTYSVLNANSISLYKSSAVTFIFMISS